MRPIKDYTGIKIGRLTGLSILKKERSKIYWVLRCECEALIVKTSKQLVETEKKKLKMMCDDCKLKTYKNPQTTKLYKISRVRR